MKYGSLKIRPPKIALDGIGWGCAANILFHVSRRAILRIATNGKLRRSRPTSQSYEGQAPTMAFALK